MKQLEIERRFLIKTPLSKDAMEILAKEMPLDITQTYLKSVEGIERVRSSSAKIGLASFDHFHHTKKTYVSLGIAEEEETELKKEGYEVLLLSADPERKPIDKTRYHLLSGGKTFELDIFHGSNEGLVILEVELASLEEKIEPPSFLEIVREITGEKDFSNYQLSKRLQEKKEAANDIR